MGGDILEFVLQLKDMMSGGLQKAGVSAHQVFTGIEKDVNRVQTVVSNLGKNISIKVDTLALENAQREISRTSEMLEALHSNNRSYFGGGIAPGNPGDSLGFGGTAGAMMMGNAALQGIEMGARKAYELGMDSLRNGMNIQNMEVGLSTLTHSMAEAKRQVADIQETSAHTPYTTQALLPGIRGIESAQYSYDRAKRDVLSLANAVSASGGNNFVFERVMAEWQHAAASGHIDGMVLREMTKNGIPITPLLQQSVPGLKGLSREKAQEKLDNMTLSYDLVSEALYKASQTGGMFDHALDKLSQNIEGKWSTIMDYWQMGSADMILGQENVITNIEDEIIKMLKQFPEYMQSKKPAIDEFVNRWRELYEPVKKITEQLYEWGKPVMGFITSENSKDLVKLELNEIAEAAKLLKHPFELLLETADALKPVMEAAIYLPTKLIEGLNWLYEKIHPDEHKVTGIEGIAADGRKNNASGIAIVPGSGNNSIGAVTTEDWWLNPDATGRKKEKNKNANDAAMVEGADAIVGGGRKIMNLNFNAPLIKIDHQHFEQVADAVKNLEPQLKEMLLRVLGGIPA